MTIPVSRITTVCCEDEPLARSHLCELIAGTPTLELCGEAADGASAVALIARLRPQLVFLDIRMPELDGLSVLARLPYSPSVVFTTAYDAHAVQAFELGAVDYLLKPFGRERFDLAMTRVTRALAAADDVPPVQDRLPAAGTPVTRLFVRERGRIVPIVVRDIEWLEAEDDYVTLHLRGKRHLLTITLASLMERLDPRQFIRIHRSHAVNLDAVASMEPYDAGRLSVTLRDGKQLTASRSGTQALRALGV
jgi:two-component system LytT family response regulator